MKWRKNAKEITIFGCKKNVYNWVIKARKPILKHQKYEYYNAYLAETRDAIDGVTLHHPASECEDDCSA